MEEEEEKRKRRGIKAHTGSRGSLMVFSDSSLVVFCVVAAASLLAMDRSSSIVFFPPQGQKVLAIIFSKEFAFLRSLQSKMGKNINK